MRTGNRFAVQRITGFSGRRPVLMVIGGSQGSVTLNTWVDRNFDALLDSADVIHITGIGKGISRTHARYFSRPYVLEELPHLYAIADVVVTRAGAAALSELALLRKAAVVVPLAGVGHDHQVRNGEALTKAGAAVVIEETNEKDLLPSVQSLLLDPERRTLLGDALYRMFPDDAASRLARVILDASEGKRLESRPTSPSSHA
jgi:UDP-N-acetylglucosamine--N-acetylmuramyl-(pentapeptide) pyrophosphoryl-undecaprenol N-acetylglucosamine transferase